MVCVIPVEKLTKLHKRLLVKLGNEDDLPLKLSNDIQHAIKGRAAVKRLFLTLNDK